MTAGTANVVVTKEELSKHNKAPNVWISIDGRVYDVSNFAKRHPGGERLMLFFAGQDASDAFHSFHIIPERSYALMDTMFVGRLAADADVADDKTKKSTTTKTTSTTTTVADSAKSAAQLVGLPAAGAKSSLTLLEDFRQLRRELHDEGYFEANVGFFMAWFAHVIAIELLAAFVANYFDANIVTRFVLTGVLLAVAQIQAGWLQHDFGHLSVFKSIRTNDLWHKVTIMALKGASAQWWKTRHNRHHAKTNVLGADPDIDNDPLFLLGERMAERRRGWLLTKFQHFYWFFIGPPLVTSFLFVYQNIKFVQQRKLHEEKLWIVGFFVRYFATYTPAFGVIGSVLLYFFMRVIESVWFTWITSMSHLPMHIDDDDEGDWLTHTLATTQNLAGGSVNNWITGHLNYQVEHHLFPTMPRHNYPIVARRVEALCARHGLKMRTRTLWEAAWDIVEALRVTAEHIEAKKKLTTATTKKQK